MESETVYGVQYQLICHRVTILLLFLPSVDIFLRKEKNIEEN